MSKLEIIATFGYCTAPQMAEHLEVDISRQQATHSVGELIESEGAAKFVVNNRERQESWLVPDAELSSFVTGIFAALSAPEVLVGGHQTVAPRVVVRWRSLTVPNVPPHGEFDGFSTEPDPVILQKMADDTSSRESFRQWARETLALQPHSHPTAVRRLLTNFVRSGRE